MAINPTRPLAVVKTGAGEAEGLVVVCEDGSAYVYQLARSSLARAESDTEHPRRSQLAGACQTRTLPRAGYA